MASVVPHINTLIVDVGTEYTKAGYAGDYHPFAVAETRAHAPAAMRGSAVADADSFVDVVQHYAAREGADSIIIVEHSSEPAATRAQISRLLVDRDVCGSFYFMKSAVCEVFGAGRTSGCVLSCSAGSTSIAVVVDGEVVECHKMDAPEPSRCPAPLRDVLAGVDPALATAKAREIAEAAFPHSTPVDISGIVGRPCELALAADMEWYYRAIDRLMELRGAHRLVKATVNGSVLFTGGYFQNRAFFALCRGYLTSRYGAGAGELVVGDGSLNLCFTGASIFGMNVESKPLFAANPRRARCPAAQ